MKRILNSLNNLELFLIESSFEPRPYFDWVQGFNTNISFMFQAVRNLSTYPTNLCVGLFVIFGYPPAKD